MKTCVKWQWKLGSDIEPGDIIIELACDPFVVLAVNRNGEYWRNANILFNGKVRNQAWRNDRMLKVLTL
jgi:hypothetical protein